MSKSKHCKDIANKYIEFQDCKQAIENIDIPDTEFNVNTSYANMLNSMADWITLFSYMELQLHKKDDHKIQTVLNELEKNIVIQRMIVSLTESQVRLYIAIFQHDTIWKDCWNHILPFMNHTIMTDVKRFKEQFQYDINAVVANLVHSLVDEK
jgi:hypothetical protein